MPEVGRFASNDRFSEKLPQLSSYQYGSANPIKFIDINGDSLWISYKGKNILFDNGKLFNADGTQYDGKLNGFLKRAFSALNSINSTSEGRSMFDEISASKNNVVIKSADGNPRNRGGNEYVDNNRNASYAVAMKDAKQGKPAEGGSGGTVYWNPNAGTVMELGGEPAVRPITNLGHELFHAYDGMRGLLDNRPSPTGLGIDEARASYFENILRKSLNYHYREYYNTVASGPIRLLDANNKPIPVADPKVNN